MNRETTWKCTLQKLRICEASPVFYFLLKDKREKMRAQHLAIYIMRITIKLTKNSHLKVLIKRRGKLDMRINLIKFQNAHQYNNLEFMHTPNLVNNSRLS